MDEAHDADVLSAACFDATALALDDAQLATHGGPGYDVVETGDACVVDHGTVFVGFSCEQSRLQRMLERMAGAEDGIRDALTRHTTPLTGAYYIVPSMDALKRVSS